MKKYGYSIGSGTAPAPTPNQNMDLLLRNLIVETQWEQEQKKEEQEDAASDAASAVQGDGAEKEIMDSLSALPHDSGILILQSQMDVPVRAKQVHSTYRPPPLDIGSEPEDHMKHVLDKKV